TVHVFLEQRESEHDAGDASFLYPFLGGGKQPAADTLEQVAASIQLKAQDDARLRERVAREQAAQITAAAHAIRERLLGGGKLITFGNGGSATDANDLALDCVLPPAGYRAVPAISLSMEPAILTAVGNDVGTELIFLRQLIAHARPGDVAVGMSTSGGSRNICLALQEARKRGLLTVALLGYDGGDILRGGLADFSLVVHSDYIPRIQEVQASIYHVLRESLEVLARA
ncbi:MAG: SIS domain-containing protein, partial [Bryobacteraceae bacterium]